MATAIYNDTETGPWLAELERSGLIMRGPVHTGSIADLRGEHLAGFERVHLFSGIGGWDLALQLAGWPEDAEVWTGSCPCQPFSTAGKRKGTTDERHLWPEMRRLIDECQPPIIFGEQVASRAGRAWLSGVRADLEALGYAFGAADLCAAGVGAPHIRQRLFWGAVRLEDANRERRHGEPVRLLARPPRHACAETPRRGDAGWVVNSIGTGLERFTRDGGRRNQSGRFCEEAARSVAASGVSGFWDESIVITLRDGSRRRIEPVIFPLVDGIPAGLVPRSAEGMAGYVNATAQARKPRIHGYGNAIVPHVAATFIRAFMASIQEVLQCPKAA